VRGLPSGVYQLVAFAFSTVTYSFNQARVAVITVAPDPQMVIDAPGPGPLTLPAMVGGWTLDRAAEGDTGIDAVHVWAYPSSGAPPIFAGAAVYGAPRPDVAAAFNRPDFANSGFGLILQDLDPGSYMLVVFAHRHGAPSFDVVKTVNIEVQSPTGR
jgi:hypothetical protein